MKQKITPLPWMSRVRQEIVELLQCRQDGHKIRLSQDPRVVTFPVGRVYNSPSRDAVARRAPYPLLPSMALPPGHAVSGGSAGGGTGPGVVVYRDASTNKLHAHVNQCRHRGAPMLKSDTSFSVSKTKPLKIPRFTCPYHAWTYDAVSGGLLKVPGEGKEAFGELDKSCRGLKPMGCFEKAGMIWIGDENQIKKEFNNVWKMEEMHNALEPFLCSWDEMTNYGGDAGTLVGYHEWPQLPANWQLLVETFLESYHVKALHAKTLHPVTHPTGVMASEWMDDGMNFRMTVPLKNFKVDDEDDDCNKPQSFLGQTTTTHLLFPMTSVTLFKRFMIFLTIEPAAVSSSSAASGGSDNSRIRVWAFSHPFYDPSSEENGSERRRRDFDAILAAVQEDWDMAVDIQTGLCRDTTSNETEFLHGLYEANNQKFLENVARAEAQLHVVHESET
eukprot:scaffold1752_cov188-Amphora_coffeaeformis.AAC.10